MQMPNQPPTLKFTYVSSQVIDRLSTKRATYFFWA